MSQPRFLTVTENFHFSRTNEKYIRIVNDLRIEKVLVLIQIWVHQKISLNH